MRRPVKRTPKPARVPRVRGSPQRQRQRLIDACIAALHLYGPSRTTVEKVVAIAKMSPGIVRFYFASKAAMLVASLQFLSSEFEEQLLVPVTRLKSRPVDALRLLVELYLDPEIASPRKVSVWYAFWGEASSRQEYYDICGQKDESFAALVRELIERLILESGQTQLDADGVALGLIGVLEMLWQDFAFRAEAQIDRSAAKARAMAYLRSVFPAQFAATGAARPGVEFPPAWVYADARVYQAERDRVFREAWQVAAHVAELPAELDFLTVDLRTERVLLIRDRHGDIRALRNSCPRAPHVLVEARRGRAATLRCALHGVEIDLDARAAGSLGAVTVPGGGGAGPGGGFRGGTGTGAAAGSGVGLIELMARRVGDWIFVRNHTGGPSEEGSGVSILSSIERSMPLAASPDRPVAADWKLLVEQWLELGESAASGDTRAWQSPAKAQALGATGADGTWSARAYGAISGHRGEVERRFAAPNQFIEVRPDGVSIWQVLPVGPGKCVIRCHRATVLPEDGPARALAYLAARQTRGASRAAVALAESVQEGLVTLGHQPAQRPRPPAAVLEFRRWLAARVPPPPVPPPLDS